MGPKPLRKATRKQAADAPGGLNARWLAKASALVSPLAPKLAAHLGRCSVRVRLVGHQHARLSRSADRLRACRLALQLDLRLLQSAAADVERAGCGRGERYCGRLACSVLAGLSAACCRPHTRIQQQRRRKRALQLQPLRCETAACTLFCRRGLTCRLVQAAPLAAEAQVRAVPACRHRVKRQEEPPAAGAGWLARLSRGRCRAEQAACRSCSALERP